MSLQLLKLVSGLHNSCIKLVKLEKDNVRYCKIFKDRTFINVTENLFD